MRKMSEPRRAATPEDTGKLVRTVSPKLRAIAGGGILMLLALLYWLIFYQTLPDNPLNPTNITSSQAPVSTGNSMDRFLKVCMILVGVTVIAARWSVARQAFRSINLGLAAFMVLIPLSALWSIDRAATLLRFSTLAGIVLVCFAISITGWNKRRLQQLTIPPVMCILLASLVLGAMYPQGIIEIGDDLSQKGAWHGITVSKNLFGMLASVGVVLCSNLWLSGARRSFLSLAGAAAALLCLVLSRSSTSLFATCIAVFFMVLVMRVPIIKQRYSTYVVVGLAVALVVTELLIQRVIPGISLILSPITSLTGKDATFSARTTIWDIIKEHIRMAPLLGSGYAAYWTGANPGSPSYIFVYAMYFYPSESHNGYLEVMNDLGLAGLLCLLLYLIWYVRHALQLMQFDRSQAAMYLALLYLQLVMNMSESDWISRSNTFAVFTLATTCLARAVSVHRRHAQSARAHGT